MDFYLVRHSQAKPEAEDPRRPLSDEGRREAEKVARAAAARGVRVSAILHSDKLRARQTAEIFRQFLAPAGGTREARGLAPDDDPMVARAELEEAAEPLMLVGHLPHLGRLTSLLVAGDPERVVVDFPSAALVCVSLAEGRWRLQWTLTPQTA
ncbi:MAG: phosphohistidine phosphatase SixA [Deltaproteobacteria bacterium]|nr:phosphohistidine phosphatase SixA [Deltaproteobacteria bacterium]